MDDYAGRSPKRRCAEMDGTKPEQPKSRPH
jgi:hypothetical protein